MTEGLRKMKGTLHLFPISSGEGVKIGQYTISVCNHGGLWIEHESGEGMQLTGDRLEELSELIDEFYKRTF